MHKLRICFCVKYELFVMNVFAANLAWNKPANQISTYYAGVASYANDASQTSSCTYAATNAWWAVDLEAAYDVNSVTVTNDHNSYFCNYISPT